MLWYMPEGKPLYELPASIDAVDTLAFSPDGSLLVTGSWRQLKIWDMTNGNLLTTLEGHSSWILSAEFSPDSRILATASLDGTLWLWGIP